MPPVDVAAATRPLASRATQPTVPPDRSDLPPRQRGPPLFAHPLGDERARRGAARSRSRTRTRRRPRRPAGRAASAPSPSGPRRSGFFTSRNAPTAPARPSPHITEASHSTSPSTVSAEPVPALNRGSSSRTTTAATAASSAEPPRARTSYPARAAARHPASGRLPVAVLGRPIAGAAMHDDRGTHLARDHMLRSASSATAARVACAAVRPALLALCAFFLLLSGAACAHRPLAVVLSFAACP